MTVDAPVVRDLETAVYVVSTDAPEADGTLAWDETTMVLVNARAGGEQGIGWSYTAVAAQSVVTDARRTCTRTWPPLSRTCAMWSTSMTISASSRCSLTVRSIQAAEC
jgi:hypothetical protein